MWGGTPKLSRLSNPANPSPLTSRPSRFPTRSQLHVNPDTGLTHTEVPEGERVQRSGRAKRLLVLMFLGKFWGQSAWMLEPIMMLPAGTYPDARGSSRTIA